MIYLIQDAANDFNMKYPGISESDETYWWHYARMGKELYPESMEICDVICGAHHPIFNSSSLMQLLISSSDGLEYRYVKIEDVPNVDMKDGDLFVYLTVVHYSPYFFALNMHFLDDRIMELCRQQKCLIIFDNTFEGEALHVRNSSTGMSVLDIYKKRLDDLGLPYSHTLLLNNSMTVRDDFDQWVKDNDLVGDLPQVDTLLYDLVNSTRLFDLDHAEVPYEREHMTREPIDFQNVIKERVDNNAKYFLRINRTQKIERDYLLGSLIHENMLDNSIISHSEMHDLTDFHSSLRMTFEDDIDGEDIMMNIGMRTARSIIEPHLPLDADESDRRNRLEYNADLPYDTKLYTDSMLSIISTSFPERAGAMHLTACVFNPIFLLHPFVIMGHMHTLKYLRSYGFKTFDKWIDESYDDIECMYRRMVAVGDVIGTLSRMPRDEFNQMILEMEDVLQHNRKVILENKEMEKITNIVRKLSG